jgi:hypothetical protein
MALKQNFKNGVTLSALLGLICNVLLPSTTLNISLLSSPSWLFITRGAILGRTGLQTYSINLIGKTSLSKLLMPLYKGNPADENFQSYCSGFFWRRESSLSFPRAGWRSARCARCT